jgi:hypothetical protein
MLVICPTGQVAFRRPATLHGVVFDILAARPFEREFSNVIRVVPAKVRYACQRVPKSHIAMGSLHNWPLLFAAPWHKIACHMLMARRRPNPRGEPP